MKRIALFSLASVLFVGCNDAAQPVDDEVVVHELKALTKSQTSRRLQESSECRSLVFPSRHRGNSPPPSDTPIRPMSRENKKYTSAASPTPVGG